MFRPPAVASINNRRIYWSGTSSPPIGPPAVPSCCGPGSTPAHPSCAFETTKCICTEAKQTQFPVIACTCIGSNKMNHPWRGKGASPGPQCSLRTATDASWKSHEAHSTGAPQHAPLAARLCPCRAIRPWIWIRKAQPRRAPEKKKAKRVASLK